MTIDLDGFTRATIAAAEARAERAEAALREASNVLVFMRAKGSVAIAGFVRDTKATAPVVEMLDRLDEAIFAATAVLAQIDKEPK